jgi:hypothetical protein
MRVLSSVLLNYLAVQAIISAKLQRKPNEKEVQVLHQQPDARALLLQCHPSLCAPSNDAVQLQATATRSSPARFHVPKSPLAIL